MNVKSFLQTAPIMLLCATLSTAPAATAPAANAPSPAASPEASVTAKQKLSPEAIKAARLKRLKNQVGLTPDQETKAKTIIDKYVDDRQAAKGDHAQLVALKNKFDADINAILTPEQQKKLAASRRATAEKLKAARAAKAAASPSASPAPAKSN
jgi:hypothetical protein